MILKVRSLHSTILWLAINKCGREFPFTTFRCRLLFFHIRMRITLYEILASCRSNAVHIRDNNLWWKQHFQKSENYTAHFQKTVKGTGELLRSWDILFLGNKKGKSVDNQNFISSFSASFSNVCRLRWYTKTTAVHKQELDVYPLPTWLMTWKKDTVHASQKRLFVPPV